MAHIQIRISEEEKEYAQQLFSSMGLTMSGAIKLFIRKSIQKDSLPFDISAHFTGKKKGIQSKTTGANKTKQKEKPQSNENKTVAALTTKEKSDSQSESIEKKRSFSNFVRRDI